MKISNRRLPELVAILQPSFRRELSDRLIQKQSVVSPMARISRRD